MKKQYVKPMIIFESFALSSSIAASCSLMSNPLVAYQCPVMIPDFGESIFTSPMICELSVPGDYDGVCYDVPVVGLNVFSS